MNKINYINDFSYICGDKLLFVYVFGKICCPAFLVKDGFSFRKLQVTYRCFITELSNKKINNTK